MWWFTEETKNHHTSKSSWTDWLVFCSFTHSFINPKKGSHSSLQKSVARFSSDFRIPVWKKESGRWGGRKGKLRHHFLKVIVLIMTSWDGKSSGNVKKGWLLGQSWARARGNWSLRRGAGLACFCPPPHTVDCVYFKIAETERWWASSENQIWI